VAGASKSFVVGGPEGVLPVLRDIRFDVAVGEFMALVGPSGCGKTTLLKMMAGLESIDSGVISIRGQVVSGVPLNIGFVFQEPGLLPWRTARQNVEIGLVARKKSRPEIREAVDHYLAITGLSDYADYPPYRLSGGMQQRVALARALVGEPDVLLMDEPFGALDAITRTRLQDELVDIIQKIHTSTVLVTHDVEEAIYCSDRMAVFGPRPTGVQKILEVPLSRPRSRREWIECTDLVQLREEVLGILNTL
jgi:ABC-type nitrate/sulfonate/bicarbonate transport system, ATPase component